jgi:hypothetical protein
MEKEFLPFSACAVFGKKLHVFAELNLLERRLAAPHHRFRPHIRRDSV